ncbi:aspartate kinase [Pelagibacterium xiamenense]|uniref:aspartate kinase n=1 Tax=Pelagibacterium xiamenense TaxID=2901140 RepID=UPI001E3C1D18|nr:aspartate kinase [Pelagibacterium xiamenense]MCD7059448.1 aspartate kinase [Pelagibacterium xiamenense]
MTKQPHTVEKIGGTSMSRSHELLDTVLVGDRKGDALYNRVFVVSAYGGMTDALLEHKKSGEPGVYSLFSSAESGWSWGDALSDVCRKMIDKNAEIFADPSAREMADKFIRERVEGVRSCLIDLSRLCSFGHFQLEQHLLTVREMLSSLGEAHSAYNTVLLLKERGVNARMVDLTGWRQDGEYKLDEQIANAFEGIDLSSEMPIVTGYAQCAEVLMKTYDRGYSEVTLSRVAVVTGAAEAIIHKEFHLSSADPKLVGEDRVRVIGETNYDVADQLSNMGMEAIHPRAAKSLRQSGIPLRVKNAFEPEHPGTVIRSDLEAKRPGAEIVTGLKGVFALEFYDQDMVGVKGYDSEILEALTRHKVWIISKTSNANTITHFLKGSMKAIKRVEADLAKAFPTASIGLRKVAMVSAIGRNLRGGATLARAIGVLAEAGIEPLGMTDMIRKVDLQVIVDEDDFDKTIIALHRGLVEDAGKSEAPRAKLHAAA